MCTNIKLPIQRQLPEESAIIFMYKINMVYSIQDSTRPIVPFQFTHWGVSQYYVLCLMVIVFHNVHWVSGCVQILKCPFKACREHIMLYVQN